MARGETKSLQWGRDVTVADRRELRHEAEALVKLQWGRDVTVADRSRVAQLTLKPRRFNGAAT